MVQYRSKQNALFGLCTIYIYCNTTYYLEFVSKKNYTRIVEQADILKIFSNSEEGARKDSAIENSKRSRNMIQSGTLRE